MKIEAIKILAGANVYSHDGVIVAELDLADLNKKTSQNLNGFTEKLLERLPTLKEHHCNRARPGGFVERLKDGTHLNHVLEHVALELLTQAGAGDLRQGKRCRGNEEDLSKAVIETTLVETARYVLPVAAQLVEAVAAEKSYFLEEKIVEAKHIAADTELGPSGRCIVEAAERRGIPWTRENEHSLIQLGYGRNLHLVQSAMSDATSAIAVEMASDKDATKQRLEKFSIPVPRGEIAMTAEETVAALEKLGAPVVVKPLDGRQGKGVSLNLSLPEEVQQAFKIAQKFSSAVLVEEQFEGNNYRVLVIGGEMVAAAERVPCHVVGNGVNTVGELIEIENQNPLRGEGHEKPLTKIKVDQILLTSLQKSGWMLESIAPAGERVMLCAGMNLSTGGTARDVTDEVHQTVRDMCERAARLVGMDICGVDLVLPDISEPLPEKKGGVIELNAAPGLRMHVFPSIGQPRDVGGAIVNWLYSTNADARIPIFAITGTNGKTTVTRMINRILCDQNLTVGMTTTDGIYLNERLVVKGDTTGPVSAKTVLGDKAVEIAVLETARGGIVKRGLGYDWSDIGVITNISAEHIGQDGIKSVDDLIRIKALVAERIKPGGTLIINADDPNALKVLEREAVKQNEKQIVYFSLDENNPLIHKHLKGGGTAYFVRGNQIVEATDGFVRSIVNVAALPVTMNGTADFQIQNALSAIAACRAYGVASEQIAHSLKNFQCVSNNAGRANLYSVGEGHVLVDYGHNPEAFRAVCRMTAQWTNQRIIGIIGVPGDRDEIVIREAGRAAAKGFDRIIIKEDKDTRGRRRGEVAGLLCAAVASEAPELQCITVFDEIEAFSKELENVGKNDVIVIFYDKLAPVLEVLQQYSAVPVSGPDFIERAQAAEASRAAAVSAEKSLLML